MAERCTCETDHPTQLGRALQELGIGSILAYSPPAKGRIERSFLTAQDRLVKHQRQAKISTLSDANKVSGDGILAGMEQALPAARGGGDLAAILCHVAERVIGND